MRFAFYRNALEALLITADVVRYGSGQDSIRAYYLKNVEFLVSLSDPQKALQKFKELGFSVIEN